jgi:drug/metabolite transporter (DMT)-like permease
MKKAGIIILVVGILMATITGFNVITHKKVVDIGSIEITKEEKTPIYWSPWTGLFLIVLGGVFLVADFKNKN